MGCFAAVAAFGATLTLASGGQETLTIGIETSFPPYVMQDDVNGMQGFDVDLMTEICARTAYDCKWQVAAFDELIPGVVDGRFDLALGGMAITQERLLVVDFSTPYFASDDREWYIGAPGAPLPETARIAVQSGTLHESYLRQQGLALQTYATEEIAVQAVADGRADLAFGPFEARPDLQPLLDAGGLELLYDVEVENLGTGIAVCKGNDTLLTRLNTAIESMTQDGTLYDLEDRWF